MSPAQRVLLRAAAMAGCAVLVLASCTNTQASINRRPQGGTATASAVDGLQQIIVKTGDTYRFDPATIIVHPGRVRVVLINTGKGAPHNWTLRGDAIGLGTPLASSGETKTATFDAPAPGRYRVVCTIHEKQGQTGQLVVLTN
ncbi:MAG: plastocyanin/azurin family copper-binding protein [Pseudonocardiales bacterium]